MIYTILRKISFYIQLFFFGLVIIFFTQINLKNTSFNSAEKLTLITPNQPPIKDPQLINLFNEKKIVFMDNIPVKNGNLSSKYGVRKDPFNGKKRMHSGIDIAAKTGSSIYPLGKGKVIYSGYKSGYGNIVEISHGKNIISRYAHLKKSLVKKGQHINKQDIIAQVGSTGRSTGPHLHLEILISGQTIDPEIFLIGNVASLR